MPDLKVSTDYVANVADRLQGHNESIEELSLLMDKCSSFISDCWRSTSSGPAYDKYKSISSRYYSHRKTVMGDAVSFLRAGVSMGYTGTEERNNNLADSFLE